MLTCAIISLGCPKNLVDSEQMLGLLEQHSFQPTYDVEDADVVIINTCGFLAASREEGMENIREMEELRLAPTSPLRCLIVAGCLVTRDKEELVENCPGVDAFLDVFSRDNVLDAVAKIFPDEVRESAKNTDGNTCKNGNADENGEKGAEIAENIGNLQLPIYEKTEPLRETYYERTPGIASDPYRFPLLPPHIAYLKIAEGCNRRCAFCAIPNIRGKYTSKPMVEIVAEARKLAENGVKELILIAQDTSFYGMDLRNADGTPTEDTLANLLRLLNDVEGIHWIRVLYLYPQNFGEDLIRALAEVPKVVPYVDMPLQHINDRVLKNMRRAAGREETLSLLVRLRERIPNLTIRTAFIAGFPGETKSEFEELLAFLRKQRFEHVAVFQFSPEEGTPAAEMAQQVPEKVSLKRTNDLILTQKRISAEWTRKLVGQTLEILIDMETSEPGTWVGHGPFGAPEIDGNIYVSVDEDMDENGEISENGEIGAGLEVGAFYMCEIVGGDEYDLFAVPVKKVEL
ncbi:MAG: 30S ribosomal protein S12 methylthiotransferase RimO [Planctomycetia bacterium]|nr:30S ribosomal protein S12 methylthiotransferase RimO [Planctomycetia bacterium]